MTKRKDPLAKKSAKLATQITFAFEHLDNSELRKSALTKLVNKYVRLQEKRGLDASDMLNLVGTIDE